ncbi:nucleotidyl transferase AbiEii/AbiGii toxin family protein [uncultured Ruminococcus sp.]|jgi:predicted nucleotidyltransferase component of viral defense system|uniref:nucleotidyl transferase AbiEii/AbiGii toxin family protein n=1 Tax=uncultured Ruminococcus sp. TaxID=165186 RepID=UPI00292ED548|nr:nucleotidyl transferase AbiEii/AbiGii toxin family protein [uncultured Ruminococcus sp.]
MLLHNHPDEFRNLITLTAREIHIPEQAVERDYYIVRSLQFLANSEYAEDCVFKGGTSLSKCYPGSIERFSEDIDLTYYATDGLSDKQIERRLKAVEKLMTEGADTEVITSERNNRNKSIYFWYGNLNSKIKLEIGSSVRPEPFGKRTLKTYIQDYLETHGFEDAVEEFELSEVTLNVLKIERTFIDKVMSVKRHAICGTLNTKVRHIYDVVRLYQMPEIQSFFDDKAELKRLIRLTKETDSVYLQKRNIPEDYDPTAAYDFPSWQSRFDSNIRSIYERLHETLLYTDEKQDFDKAIQVFDFISRTFREIEE